MTHITIALPDAVVQQYYNASEKLSTDLMDLGKAPNAQTLMRFILASFNEEDVAKAFDTALRNLAGAPIPDETDTWVFSPEFENAP